MGVSSLRTHELTHLNKSLLSCGCFAAFAVSRTLSRSTYPLVIPHATKTHSLSQRKTPPGKLSQAN